MKIQNKKKKSSVSGFIVRLLVYIIGLLIITIGINISKLSSLGISPVSSIPAVLAGIIPDVSLGNMVIVVYCVLVLAQFIVLRKKFKWKNILGVPVALIFGLMVDFTGVAAYNIKIGTIDLGIPYTFNGLLINFPKPSGIVMQFVYLFASMIIIGIGVFIYLRPKLVPMPAEGLAAALSEVSKKPFGNCKTLVDVSLIVIALVLQVIFLGGFGSLWIGNGIVGIGTILAAVLVGQIVKLLSKLCGKQFDRLLERIAA